MPVRIQRKRTKGWKMPEGAVYVGRPTIWGNPFYIGPYTREQSLALFAHAFSGFWSGPYVYSLMGNFDHMAHEDYNRWQKKFGSCWPRHAVKSELRGKDLACWCPLDKECHADILLEVANQ